VEGSLSHSDCVVQLISTSTALVGLRGRVSEPPRYLRAIEPVARALGDRLGVQPRLIGSPREAERTSDWAGDLRDARGLLLEAGGQLEDALGAGRSPILISGDCAVAMGTLPVLARLRPDARVLWLDAHGDYNTPDTSPSGWLGGMGLAGACAEWETGLPGAFASQRLVLCGVRSLDAGERDTLARSDAVVIGPSLETLVYMQHALDGAPVFVHLDPDVLDPEFFGAEYPAPGGLTPERLYDLLDAVADGCELIGLEVCSVFGLSGDADQGGLRDHVDTLIKVLDPLLSREETPDAD
jgi:arginase